MSSSSYRETRIGPVARAAASIDCIRPAVPSADQPGTYAQALGAIDLFLANPFRTIDREAAWQVARRLSVPHARRAA